MHWTHLTRALPVWLLLAAVGCTFEARGEGYSEGQSSGAEAPPQQAEPAEPAPTTVVVAEPAPDSRRGRRGEVTHDRRDTTPPSRRVRRRHHAAVDPPKGPPKRTVFGSTKPEPHTLQGNIYFLPENTRTLPDFEPLTPVGTVYAKKIDVPERRFDEGFPGISDRFEWFAVVYSGTFEAKKAGTYTFRLHSDDGARLYIDGELVVDNDGTHPPKSKTGTVDLEAGEHDIVVEYFQGPRYHIALQLFVTEPGKKKEKIFKVR